MRFCKWKVAGTDVECGGIATRASNIDGNGVYKPVCEAHYQEYRRIRKEAEARGDGVTQ